MRKNRLFILIAGILCIACGIFILVSQKNKTKRCTTPATGTVVDIEEEVSSTDNDTSYSYYPVVEFKAGDQNIKQKYSTGFGNKNKYKIGTKIDILYNPDSPNEYLIKDENSSNIIGAVFILAGIVVLLLGIFKRVL